MLLDGVVAGANTEKSAQPRLAPLLRALPYVIAATVAGAYLLLFVRILTTTVDEGTFLYEAQLVAHGAVPFRDFPEFTLGGEFYWLALFFKLFGITFLTARTVLWATGVATVLLAFHLSRRIGGTGIFAALFVLVTSIPLMTMNSPHYESNLFALAALAVFLRAEARDSRRMLFLAGILAGVASCFLQQKGFYIAVAFAISILIVHRTERLKRIGLMLGGYFSVIAAAFTFYGAVGALPQFIQLNLRAASEYNDLNAAPYGWEVWAKWIPQWVSALHKLLPTAAALAVALAVNLPYLLILALPFVMAVLLWIWKREVWRPGLVPYWAAAYALWISEFHRHDIGHLRNGCVLLAILFLSLCERHAKAWVRACALAVGACLVVDAVAGGGAALGYRTPIHSRHGTLLGRHRDQALEFLLAHTKPGDDVFVYPYRPIYYFLADVHNPTPFAALVYHCANTQEFREAVQKLETRKVRYVLWDAVFSGPGLRTVFPAYQDPPPNQLIMEPYLETHYRQIAFLNGFRVMERK